MLLDSPYSFKGKFKKGEPHGVLTSSYGSIRTYENGVLNGPSKYFFSDNCLYNEGNYIDGYREGEWITYETYPREKCGKVIKVVEVYYKGKLKE